MSLVLTACVLDALFGDPVYRWHPIRLLGQWSLYCEQALFAIDYNTRLGGVLHWLLVVGGAVGAWLFGHQLLALLHPAAAWLWDLFLAYSLLCTRDLLTQGWRMVRMLDDLPQARQQIQHLVGRDSAALDRAALVRATIESLAENFTDGVLTPLWVLCWLGLPGLIVVKAISTLDSMVGYRTARYQAFGWAAARSDDLIHWLPARCSVVLIAAASALLRLYPHSAIACAWRDHALLPSPNSGWSEAAVAGALKVRLLGPLYYSGQQVNLAFIGDPAWPSQLDAADLKRALQLILVASVLALAVGMIPQL